MLLLPAKLPEPVWETYREAQGGDPAIRVRFKPIGIKASRAARRAVAAALRIDDADVEEAGDAYSVALLNLGIVEWEGVGDAAGEAVAPTADVLVRGDNGEVVEVRPGTISLFLVDPDRFEWCDRVYVMPWVERDREKNASSGSPSGTSVRAMPGNDTASSAATPPVSADASQTPPPDGAAAPISSTSRKRTRARKPGK